LLISGKFHNILRKKNLWHTVKILSYTKKSLDIKNPKAENEQTLEKKVEDQFETDRNIRHISTLLTQILPGSAVRLPPVLKPQEKLVQDSGW